MVSFYPAKFLEDSWNNPMFPSKTIQGAYRAIRNIFKGNPTRSTTVQREKITEALNALHEANPLMVDAKNFRRHINPQKKFTFEDFGLKVRDFSIDKPAHAIPDLKGFLARHSSSTLENNFTVENHDTGSLFAKGIINEKTQGILEIKFDLRQCYEAKAKKTLVLYATYDGINNLHSSRSRIQNIKVYGTVVDNYLLKRNESRYQRESAQWRQQMDEVIFEGKGSKAVTKNIKSPKSYHLESALTRAKAISIQDCPRRIQDLIKSEIIAANKVGVYFPQENLITEPPFKEISVFPSHIVA